MDSIIYGIGLLRFTFFFRIISIDKLFNVREKMICLKMLIREEKMKILKRR